MVRRVVFPALVLLISCNKPADRGPRSNPDAAVVQPTPSITSAAPLSELCTLATPLVPGIPGSPDHLIPSDINPNGQSELSVHMRSMQAQLKAAQKSITRGEKLPPLLASFAKIRCAWPTNPADRNASFDASAQVYLAAVAALDAAAPGAAAPAYDQVLNACRSCHEHTCSGAIVAIEALRMPKTASHEKPRD